jgi:hypothetical protein
MLDRERTSAHIRHDLRATQFRGDFFMRCLLASAILAVFAGLWSHAASAADLNANREPFFSNDEYWDYLSNKESRVCDDPYVLNWISSRFMTQALQVHHRPDLFIRHISGIHENRYLPFDGDYQPIARRYCDATAVMSDGRQRSMWYLIEDGMGLAGMGDNVEFCISGLDRWLVYNGSCRVLR